jgi:MerR family regulatory protein
MRIQEAAHRLGVSPRVLRHCEAEGLIAPPAPPNGYRTYSPPEIDQAAWVRDLIAATPQVERLERHVTISGWARAPRPQRPLASSAQDQKAPQVLSHSPRGRRRARYRPVDRDAGDLHEFTLAEADRSLPRRPLPLFAEGRAIHR